MNLDDTCTQQQFGELVGVSQQAVSDHLASGEMQPGETARHWLLDYCEHLREQAAGRGADGELARERTKATQVSRERNEIQLARDRREYAAVTLIEQIIAHVASQIRDHLQSLVVQLKMRCPHLTGDDLKLVETIVFEVLNLASNMSLASLTAMDDEEGEGA